MIKHKRHRAYQRIERMKRYGSRRVKTLIRQWRDCDVLTIIGIVKELK